VRAGDGQGDVDPLRAPLAYPGLPPRPPAVLLVGTDVLAVRPLRAAPPGEWLVMPAGPDGPVKHAGRGQPLDRVLREEAVAPVGRRTPVLSVGSNASPAQLRRKLDGAGLRTVVPMTAVRAHGLAVGVSAHVSKPGYVPATPVADPAVVSGLWVLWLDADAVLAVDGTEPNYRRMRVPSRYPIRLTSGGVVPGCSVYVSRHGCLAGFGGAPRRLIDQATLIAGLLAQVPALTGLAGATPAEWMRRTRDERVRDAIRGHFRAAGIVRPTGFGTGDGFGTGEQRDRARQD
jgi:hypothetical protein